MSGAAVRPSGPPTHPAQKSRADSSQRDAGSSRRRAGPLGPFARGVISLLIVWHFFAVFLAALSVPVAGPSSQLVDDIAQRRPMQWYLDLLYLNHGHSFFAPDVGPGHVIRYELFDDRGSVMQEVKLPHTKEHWPRLRYHRHLMLADQAILPSPNREFSDRWQRKYLESYALHLLRIHEEAQAARVRRYAHWPLPREYAIQGEKIDDPRSYELLMEVTQRRSDLEPPSMNQTGAWQDGRIDSAGRWIGGPR